MNHYCCTCFISIDVRSTLACRSSVRWTSDALMTTAIMKSTREHPNMLMQQSQNANPVMISAADIQATVKWQIAIIPHSIIHLMTTTAGFP